MNFLREQFKSNIKFVYYLAQSSAPNNLFNLRHYAELIRSSTHSVQTVLNSDYLILCDKYSKEILFDLGFKEHNLELVEINKKGFMHNRMDAQRNLINKELKKNNPSSLFFIDSDAVPTNLKFLKMLSKDKISFFERPGRYPLNGGLIFIGNLKLKVAIDLWNRMLNGYDALSDEKKEWFGDQDILRDFPYAEFSAGNTKDFCINNSVVYIEPAYSLKGAYNLFYSNYDIVHYKGYVRRWAKFDKFRKSYSLIKFFIFITICLDYILLGSSWRKKFRIDKRRID